MTDAHGCVPPPQHAEALPFPETLEDRRQAGWFWDYTDVFDAADLSAHAKLVRLYLARRASHGARVAWPSLNDIARHCGISRATVKRALNELLDAGWISKEVRRTERGDYLSTVYRLNAPPAASDRAASSGAAEGGRLTQSLPCHEMTGVGSHGAYLGSDRAYVGSDVPPNKIHGTRSSNQREGLGEVSPIASSLRSDAIGADAGCASAAERGSVPEGIPDSDSPAADREPAPESGRAVQEHDIPVTGFPGTELTESDSLGVGPEAGPENERVVQTCDAAEADEAAVAELTQGASDSDSFSAGVLKVGFAPDCGSGAGPCGPPASNRDIIASLGDRFLSLPGMSERYPPGPQRTRVYALMGRLYRQYDVEPVHRAMDALERRGGAEDPLRFVAAVARAEHGKLQEAFRGSEAAAAWLEARRLEGERWLRENADLRERALKAYREFRERGREKRRERLERERWARDVLEGRMRYENPVHQKAAECRAREILAGLGGAVLDFAAAEGGAGSGPKASEA
jgi:hypothetical protein